MVKTGERVLLRSGDPAILRLAAGMEKPDSGTLMMLGTEMHTLSESEAAAFRNARVGYAGQDSNLFGVLTVLENAALPLAVRGGSRVRRDDAAKEVLATLDLSPVMYNYPGTLSISQRRRAILARALVTKPEILEIA